MKPSPTQNSFEAKTYSHFVSSNKFPYVIDKSRESFIVGNYDNIKLGMTKNEVLGIIGPPDFSEEMIGKDSRKCRGGFWTYYFNKPDPNVEDEHADLEIEAYYDAKDRLVWIIPTNIPLLKVKSSN